MSSTYPAHHKKRLGALLARARERANGAVTAYAKALEVSRQQVYDWENGVSAPDGDRFARIEEVYGIPVGSVESALLSVAGESLSYWRGRVDEAREIASDLASRLAALSWEMQGDHEEDFRRLVRQTETTTPEMTPQKKAL